MARDKKKVDKTGGCVELLKAGYMLILDMDELTGIDEPFCAMTIPKMNNIDGKLGEQFRAYGSTPTEAFENLATTASQLEDMNHG